MKLKLATKVNWRVQRISRDLIRAPSVWFIVALAALALLEIPSTTGRLLDKWGADVVAGWLGQLALLGLCVDALRGKLPRPVVLIPLLFYVSYYFAYWEQGAHIKLKSEELRRTNPGRIVAFDPRSSSLAMEKADAFAASYSVPVVYARDPSFVGDEYLSYRLVATDRIARYLSRNRDGVQVFSVYWNDSDCAERQGIEVSRAASTSNHLRLGRRQSGPRLEGFQHRDANDLGQHGWPAHWDIQVGLRSPAPAGAYVYSWLYAEPDIVEAHVPGGVRHGARPDREPAGLRRSNAL